MWKEPGNARDREAFAALSEAYQARVRELASYLYDGSRTVAACWRQALQIVATRGI
jgi:hypothetical protein